MIVRVNDRGPFHAGRVIDLSYAAAWKLGYANQGSAQVEVELLTPDAIMALTSHRRAEQIAAADPASPPPPPEQPPAAPPASPPAPETLAAAPPAGAALPISTVAGKVYLQLGAFSGRDNAENFRVRVYRDLTWLNDSIEIVPANGLFRLHLGPYGDRAEAGVMAERIREALEVNPVMVVR